MEQSTAKMKQPVMVYKSPGKMSIDRKTKKGYDYKVIESVDIADALIQGWHESPAAAIAGVPVAPPVLTETINTAPPVPEDNAPVTRAELEQKARELGVEFTPEDDDEMLGFLIDESMKSANTGEFL